ncbi:MAG: N-acetylmuramoyl-L-alanine amidase [Parvicella sp.]|jgi:N-acetylmuramoyl-L-alanine amidase
MKKDIMHHCSATPQDQELSLLGLQRMHVKVGINPPGGYHAYVRRDGTIHYLRPFGSTGAHCRGRNRDSLGFCYEGGIVAGGDKNKASDAADTRTDKQKASLIRLTLEGLAWNKDQGVDICSVEIIGHRDESPDIDGDGEIEPWEFMKQCPCYDAKSEYEDIKKYFLAWF